ncbi:hypothetical protein NQP46_28775 [Streptomyces albus]|nr:hypothetical protein NQP46_28775 [Streptomyces albus]
MGQLLGGAAGEHLSGGGDRLGERAACQVDSGEPEKHLFSQERELSAPLLGPGSVAVLRQHLAGEPSQGVRERVPRPSARAARAADSASSVSIHTAVGARERREPSETR